jgi:4-hydroxy-tetrahydrodipicolinate synthase
MGEKRFSGVFTAIITPFNEDESVDYGSLEKLIEFQIASGINGLVPCGSTGESPTLNHKEHMDVIEFVVKKVNHRCLVIAGTGSNCTKEAVELSQHAEGVGADACLIVTPYYNKPTQEGIFRHFKAVANSISIPIIVYNIKGRTGVNIQTSTLMRIAEECKNVVGVKEASGEINQIREVISKCAGNFSVLSGDDNLTLDVVKSGGDGIISVASNVVPKEMIELTSTALNGDFSRAEQVNEKLTPLFHAEFVETNPIPIKAMLSQMGFCKEIYRLPLCELMPENKGKVLQVIQQLNLI